MNPSVSSGYSRPAAAMNGFSSAINSAKPFKESCWAPSLRASAGFGCADAPLTEHQTGIAVGQHILAGQEPFLDAHREPSFEQDRFAGFGRSDEQLKIL